jgi:hypothetical protein
LIHFVIAVTDEVFVMLVKQFLTSLALFVQYYIPFLFTKLTKIIKTSTNIVRISVKAVLMYLIKFLNITKF